MDRPVTEELLRRKLVAEGIPTFWDHGTFLDSFERTHPERYTGITMLRRVAADMGGEIV